MEFSNPLSEEKRQEIQELVSVTLKTFCTTYGLKFTAGLIEAVKGAAPTRRRSTYAPQGLQLVSVEAPSELLYEGSYEKRGNFIKNWKTRWFAFGNKKDNYVVSYYTDEKMTKLKGEICLDGYTVSPFDDETKEKFGEHGLMMTAPKRRSWYIRGENDEAVAAALFHFKNATKKARPAFKEGDKVEGAAFSAAYTATRRAFEIYPTNKQPAGSEADALGEMLFSLVMNNVLSDVLDAIPEGMGCETKKKTVITVIEKLIAASVKAVWDTGKALIRQGRSGLEAGIKSALTPLFDAEKMVLGKITDACKATIEPAMEKLMSGSGKKLVSAVCSPIKGGYTSTITCWAEIAQAFTKMVTADGSTIDMAETVANKAIWDAGEALKLATNALLGALEGLGDLLSAFDPADLVSNVLDSLTNLMLKGIATLKVTITSGSTPDEAYLLTLKKIVGDAKIMFADAVRGMVVAVIQFPFDELVRGPCLELVAPLDELIPAPVKAFVSATALMETVFDTTIEAAAEAVASPLTSPEEASIGALETELA